MSEPTDDSLVDKLDKLCDGIVAVLEEGGAAPEPPKPAPGDPAPEPEPEPETVHYSRGRDKYDAYPEQRTAASFEAFVAAVLADRSQRKGLAYVAGPFAIGADGRHHRCKEGILPRRFLALDLDGSTPDGFAEVCMYLVAYRGFGYLTARHTPARPRARFILELSRPVSGAEGACLGTALQRRIEARRGNGVLEWDKSVYEGHQPVYTPLVGAKDMHYDGAPVDVDQILNDAPPLERPGGRSARRQSPAVIPSCGHLPIAR